MAKTRGLGRGLGSLIGDVGVETSSSKKGKSEEKVVEEDNKNAIVNLKISDVEPDKNQPRKNFDDEALNELAESINRYGVIQPIMVVKKDKHYEIVAGERRWRAAKIAGLKEIPAIIRDYEGEMKAEVALIDNLQREDLNAIEQAEAYNQLMLEYDLTQEDLAEKVSKSRSAVANTLRLLKLTDNLRKMLVDGTISAGHARALLALPDDLQEIAAQKVESENLSVRDTEELVKKLITKKEKENEQPEVNMGAEIDKQADAAFEAAAKSIENILNTKVVVKNKPTGKGKIEISYYSLDEFERLMDLFKVIR